MNKEENLFNKYNIEVYMVCNKCKEKWCTIEEYKKINKCEKCGETEHIEHYCDYEDVLEYLKNE